MNNVKKLPAVQANEWIDEKLSTDRTVEWAIDYHRKQVLMIEEERKKGDFYHVSEGEVLMSLHMGIDLEMEQAMRALIMRINELESQDS